MLKTKRTVTLLRLFWLFFIIYNEHFIYWFSAMKCSTKLKYPQAEGKFLLIADPQMTDDHSYNRNTILMSITKFISSQYMKRNYKNLKQIIQPSDIFIMGDLMDSGRDWDDAFYAKEVERFHKIFPIQDTPIHYMAGNHDLGFGDGVTLDRIERFEKHFGPTHYSFKKNGYRFLVINSLLPVSVENGTEPTILMSHVPLFRDGPCEPGRQTNQAIKQGRGYQYQNLLDPELSRHLLETLKPVVVFSGDDHDYCLFRHSVAPEVTVPTFSMAQGVRRPGLVVLQIQGGLSYDLCWLPDQIQVYLSYGMAVVLTLFVLALKSSKRKVSYLDDEMGFVELEKSQYSKRGLNTFLLSLKDVTFTTLLIYLFFNLIA